MINNINFKGISMGPVSKALYTLSNNDMLNASFVDIFAMDTPRTIVETKYRGKQAGIEMGFREYTGTFIAEFSAALFAFLTSKIFTRAYKPGVKVNSGSWATDNSLDVFNEVYKNSKKTPEDFVSGVLNSISGIAGDKIKSFSSIEPDETVQLKKMLVRLIADKRLSKKDSKNIINTVHSDIVKLLGADNNIITSAGGKEFRANLTHTLRDLVDLGKNVFFKEGASPEIVISKLKTLNKSRIALAIPASMLLAITNQYINRQLTKKRTGIDNFVGENGYKENVNTKNEAKKEKGLFAKKLVSAGIFLAMLTKVMGVKKPSDFITKLEFDGPATGGNAIKTIYGTLILGRIFASKDSTELRETDTRDYLGFLNWLVLGGFVSKGVAQLMDRGQKELFNISSPGKGLKHWLNNVSLKSQKEIIVQGANIKKNLIKLNAAQVAGIGYSALMLGVVLPKFNIWMTKHWKNHKKQEKVMPDTMKFNNFLNNAKMHSKDNNSMFLV